MAEKPNKNPNADRFSLEEDLNQDLTAILGRCEALKGLISNQSEAAKHVRTIQVLAHHMLDMLTERSGSGREPPL